MSHCVSKNRILVFIIFFFTVVILQAQQIFTLESMLEYIIEYIPQTFSHQFNFLVEN